MQFSDDALKAQLNAQGFDLVPIAPDLVDDVRFWPIPRTALLSSFRGAAAGLAALFRPAHGGPPLTRQSLAEAFPGAAGNADARELGRLLDRLGSDKAVHHDYYLAYGALFGHRRHEPLAILEIGIGSNNPDVPSNMGKGTQPGASLRAFRDWAPSCSVVGADVDRRILFTEDRIVTRFVDQTDRSTLVDLAASCPPGGFDLVIDDGLHTPEASINTVLFALPLLKPDGVIVVEDVGPDDAPFWDVAALILGEPWDCRFVMAKGAALVVIRRR